jgi:pimeloyl-ACP methyl ester carboxylesterase
VRAATKTRTQHVSIHGHDVAYRAAGDGPAVVFVHGIAGSSSTWTGVMEHLADRYTVIAPDLLGHGESAKPRGDYSLGAYACGIRDLLVVLGHERATFVGHSLGGGIAMQLAYQFPEMCERLVLVASGGLGKEVSPLLRVLSAPGSEYVLPVALNPRLQGVVSPMWRVLGALHLRRDTLLEEVWATWGRLTDARAQRAFVHTLRAVVDVAGQRVSARDRLYLAAEVPTLIIWGDRDGVIPVAHAHAAHELMPGSRLEIIEGAGHFVPIQAAELVADILRDFLSNTTPATVEPSQWHDALTAQTGAASVATLSAQG